MRKIYNILTGFLALIFILNMNIASSAWNDTLNIGLVRYYNMNDSAENVYGIYNLTNYEGVVSYNASSCLIGNCSQLTASRNMYIPASPDLDFSNDYSFSFWIRPVGDIADNGAFMMWRVGEAWEAGLYTTAGDWLWPRSWFGGLAESPYSIAVDINTYVNWIYVTNSTSNILYKNGVKVKEGNVKGRSLLQGFNISLGVENAYYPTNYNLAGQQEEWAIWTRSLSPSEVSQLYNSGNGITYARTIVSPWSYLKSPSNNSLQGSRNVYLKANFTDETSLKNSTLYIYNSSFNIINNTEYSNITGIVNETNISIIFPYDGIFYWNYLVCDSDNQCEFNNTNYTINIDTTKPNVLVSFPLNSSYNSNISSINFSVTESYLDSCWYSTNLGVTNITTSCFDNVTNLNSVEGSNTWIVSARDMLNNINSTKITFAKDTINPKINIKSPSNIFYNLNNITFNITSNENLSFCKFTLNNYLTNYTMSTKNNTFYNYTNVSISSGNYTALYWCNDTFNNINNTQSASFTIDIINPNMTFALGSDNSTNYSKNYIFVNVSYYDLNLKNITINLFNSARTLINSSIINNSIFYNFTFTNLADGVYYVNSSVLDKAGNYNYTETRQIILDVTPPVITIVVPLNLYTYGYNTSIELNYSVLDATLLADSCWFKLANSSGDLFYNNISLTSCSNTTMNVSSDNDIYTLTLYSNDSVNNVGSRVINFNVITTVPAISLIYPANGTFINYKNNVNINFSAFDVSGFNKCELWGNFNGSWARNYTWNFPTNNTINYTSLNLYDRSYTWNINCTNKLGVKNFASYNSTFTVDTIFPTAQITGITTTANTGVFTFNSTENDTNLDSCYYTTTNIATSQKDNINVKFICNSVITASVPGFTTYNLTIYANDSANNTYFYASTFVTSISSGGTTAGGGGGPVTIIKQNATSWFMTTSRGLSKAYEFSVSLGGSRSEQIKFDNKDTKIKNIKLRCEGNLCDYLKLSKEEITLPVGIDIPTYVDFNVNIPKELNIKELLGNIIAKDDENYEDLISIKVNIGKTSVVLDTINKIGENKEIFKGFKLPYFLIFLFFSVPIYLISSAFIFKNIEIKRVLSLGVSILLSFIVISII